VTIIVCVKINDGLVVASDSTTSFFRADEKFVQSYDNANKIFNLYKGLPVGAMTCGGGGIGSDSVSTLSKDLRRRFSGEDSQFPSWKIDEATYTVKDVAEKAHAFLLEMAQAAGVDVWLTYWVFGYSAGRPLPEIWSIIINGKIKDSPAPTLLQGETDYGPRWAGEEEALDRLILGRTRVIVDSAVKNGGLDQASTVEMLMKMGPDLYESLVMPAMPIQDAIDLARYLVETTMGFSKFSIARPKTVGGPIEIAAITKHEGFRWVARKHFYPASLNPL
jgi:predicted proteasome-type protease